MLCQILISVKAAQWIELFNGATWPPGILAYQGTFSFATAAAAVVVGFRTMLNLALVLSAVFVLYLMHKSRVVRWLMSRLESVLSSRDVAVAAYIVHQLQEHQNIEVTPELVKAAHAAAAAFRDSEAGKRFLKSAILAAEEAHKRSTQAA